MRSPPRCSGSSDEPVSSSRRMLLHLDDAETITEREGRHLVILAARPELTVTLSRYAAGQPGTDLHVHREHTDAFYVLDGVLTLAVGPGEDRIELPAGGFAAVPPNVVHAFLLDSDAYWLNLHAPDAGFAAYMRAVRDGRPAGFDSFDPPPDGGLPSAGVVLRGPDGELDAELPGCRVTTRDAPDASHRFVHERSVFAVVR
jgi:quercetin dioxygenase-like cupin family protein